MKLSAISYIFVCFNFRSVRRAFDRVVGESEEHINITQCQKALNCLGIPNNILSVDSLSKIILYYKEIQVTGADESTTIETTTITTTTQTVTRNVTVELNFDDFCIIAAYLSVLQQEIYNSACVSPIKGINVPPPPIFFTNTPG